MAEELEFEGLRYGKPTGVRTYGVKQALSEVCDREARDWESGQLERAERKFDRLLQYVAALTETLHEKGVLTDGEVVELLDSDYRLIVKLP